MGTATILLQLAAEEAWMSIKPVHVTAARVWFGLNVKSLGVGGGPRRVALNIIHIWRASPELGWLLR